MVIIVQERERKLSFKCFKLTIVVTKTVCSKRNCTLHITEFCTVHRLTFL